MTRSDRACRAIRAANSESEVIEAVREYVESLDLGDVALLPAEILSMGLAPAEELVQSALAALHSAAGGAERAADGGVFHETTLVFTAAARRLAALARDVA
jgi:hypothetical protein